jgi:hypothetical protein
VKRSDYSPPSTRFRLRAMALLALIGLFSMFLGPVLTVRADNIKNDIDAVGDFTITVGGSTTINYFIQPTGGTCDAADTSAAVVTIIKPAAVAASPASLTFNACNTDKPVQFSSSTVGSYAITVSVSDTNGSYNPVPAAFTLVVTAPSDTTPPVVSVPADITAEASGSSGAVVTFAASANDNVDGAVSVTCTPASGSTFPIATTTVTCSATDNAGNMGSKTFKVTVSDTAGPILNLPASFTIEATSASGAVATYTATATDAVDGSRLVTCSPASGSTFPLGATTVNCSASDTTGHTSNGSFSITVQDTTAPVLTVPSSAVLAEATSAAGAKVPYPAGLSATDAVTSDPTITCRAGSTEGTIMHFGASGDTFPIGTTTLYCKAVDDAGNKSAAQTFDVIVGDSTAPVVTVPADITDAEAAGASGAVVTYTGVSATDAVDGELTPTCTPASGAVFPLGTTTVTCSATDAAGNLGSKTFKVTVVDTTGPALALPDDIIVEATGPTGAVATFSASAEDAVDGDVDVACTPASGSTFALGSNTVECSATDAAGNTTADSFTVTVRDTTPPHVTVPVDKTVEATGPNGATVTYSGQSATDLVSGALIPSCSPASGSTFALGSTTVTCSAKDAAGNEGSESFKVTVVDTTAPAVTVPGNITQEATSANGAAVSFIASATDLVDGAITPSCTPASGSTFALGTTTVQCSATDAAGNTGNTSFTVTVVDTTKPTLTLPANITKEATGPGGAAVSFTVTASDLVDGSVAPSCIPASGSTFALGETTVNCSATDAAGNTANGSFTVTVQDTTKPTLTLPANISTLATGNSGAAVTFLATATDLVDGSVTVNCTPASGSTFALGTTTVNCSATDAHGNAATGSFTVTVTVTIKGFFQPVDMGGIYNNAKSGSTVPLKFEVFGANGVELTDVAVIDTFKVMSASAPAGTVGDDIELYSTGNTSLRYDATGGQFIQNWKTPAAGCYKVVLTLKDGSTITALFNVRK